MNEAPATRRADPSMGTFQEVKVKLIQEDHKFTVWVRLGIYGPCRNKRSIDDPPDTAYLLSSTAYKSSSRKDLNVANVRYKVKKAMRRVGSDYMGRLYWYSHIPKVDIDEITENLIYQFQDKPDSTRWSNTKWIILEPQDEPKSE